MERRVIVVGGGIAGLSAAYRIREQARKQGVDVELTVLEAGDTVGGKIDSARDGEWLCETGPNGFLDNEPATLRLVEDLGLGDALQRSNDASRRRYLVRGGQLVELSMHPVKFLKSTCSRGAPSFAWRVSSSCRGGSPRRTNRWETSVAVVSAGNSPRSCSTAWFPGSTRETSTASA